MPSFRRFIALMPLVFLLSFSHPVTTDMKVVNPKRCLEESKMGKQKFNDLSDLAKQLEKRLKEKGKPIADRLKEIEQQITENKQLGHLDEEQVVKLNEEANQLLENGKSLELEYNEIFQQAQIQAIQKLTKLVKKSSAQLVEETKQEGKKINMIFQSEDLIYFDSSLDITDQVIEIMNKLADSSEDPQED